MCSKSFSSGNNTPVKDGKNKYTDNKLDVQVGKCHFSTHMQNVV